MADEDHVTKSEDSMEISTSVKIIVTITNESHVI